MATAPRDTPVEKTKEYTAIEVQDPYAAGKRRRTRRRSTMKKRGGSFQFKTQDVNTAPPPPPNAPQGPLGGRRKTRTRRHKLRGGNPGGEYKVPAYPSFPPTGPFKGGKRRKH